MKIATICVNLTSLLLFVACHTANKAQKGAAIGAGTGGTVGAFIGKSAGNTALGALIGGAVGGTAGAFIGKRMDKQADELKQNVPGATVTRMGEGIIVKFDSGLLFGAGSAALTPDAQTNLQNLASSLHQNAETNVIIIGHSDNTGTPPQNMAISLKRAQTVKDFLASKGVDPARVTTLGKGDTEPIADNTTEAGRAQNRRVEVVIIASERMKSQANKPD
ncbi:MAG: OmpA family protein [Bacteroidetes bacterium]|nr:OmpA family protein [Bacteroidota bacterium]